MTRLLEVSASGLAANAAKRKAFAAKMDTLLKSRDRLATDGVHRAWDLLEDLRKSVSAELTSASGFDAFQLPRLKNALDQLGKDFAGRYQYDLATRQGAAWALGQNGIDDAMKAAGETLGTFRLDTTQLEIAQGLSADLVTRMTSESIASISTQIQRSMLAEQSVFETMRAVTDILGSSKAVAGRGAMKFVADGVAYRAEMITRTELLRAYNMASFGRAQDAKAAGVTRHEWRTAGDGRVRASHEALDGMVVEVGEEFAPGLRFPLDPQAAPEEQINCRCKTVPAFEPEGA